MTEAPVQMTLGLSLRDGRSFDSLHAGANEAVIDHLQALADGRVWRSGVFLWGPGGSGRSHLLQALCHRAAERGRPTAYLPLASRPFPLDVLDGLERMALVSLDDVQSIAGQPAWERALVRLFDRLGAAGSGWVASASRPPDELGIGHAGLVQAFKSALVKGLVPLDEAGCLAALNKRAARRGLELPATSAQYLVGLCQARTTDLFDALDALDRASLVAKRRLTIPFIRAVLGAGDARKQSSR